MFLRLTSSSLALSLVAAPALAITPEEVWTAWTQSYKAMGYEVAEGSRDLAGETLTLKDVVFTSEAEEGGAEAGADSTEDEKDVEIADGGEGDEGASE